METFVFFKNQSSFQQLLYTEKLIAQLCRTMCIFICRHITTHQDVKFNARYLERQEWQTLRRKLMPMAKSWKFLEVYSDNVSSKIKLVLLLYKGRRWANFTAPAATTVIRQEIQSVSHSSLQFS